MRRLRNALYLLIFASIIVAGAKEALDSGDTWVVLVGIILIVIVMIVVLYQLRRPRRY